MYRRTYGFDSALSTTPLVVGYRSGRVFRSERSRVTGWSDPETISLGAGGIARPVAAVRDGAGIIAWSAYDGRDCNGRSCNSVFVSTRYNGEWSDPASLADAVVELEDEHPTLAVDVNSAGDAVLAYQLIRGVGEARVSFYLAELTSVGWSVPSLDDSFAPLQETAQRPAVALDDAGNAVVAWFQRAELDGASHIQVRHRTPRGEWSPTRSLEVPGLEVTVPPVMSSTRDGRAVVAWMQLDPDGCRRVFVAEREGSSWRIPTGLEDALSPAGTSAGREGYLSAWLDVDVSESGEAVVLWAQDAEASGRCDREADGPKVILVSRRVDGEWTRPGLVDAIEPGRSRNDLIGVDVVMDEHGRMAAAWREGNVGHAAVHDAEWCDGFELPDVLDVSVELGAERGAQVFLRRSLDVLHTHAN